MTPLTPAQLRTLLTPPAPPCVSLYLPTHHSQPGDLRNQQSYRAVVDAAGQSLATGYPGKAGGELLERLRTLGTDEEFWAAAQDGLAVFAAEGFLQTFWIPSPGDGLAVVADSFHIKPLLRAAQGADRYHVLKLTRHEAKLFVGNRDKLEPVPGHLPTFAQVLGEAPARSGAGGAVHAPGHQGRRDGTNAEVDEFFRVVERAVRDHHSNPSGLPLVLVGLPDNTSEFRKHVHHNPHLLPTGVDKDPGAMTLQDIRAEAWKVVEPRYQARLTKLADDYHTAHARGLASKDVYEVAKAAAGGRVGVLLVEADRDIPGRLDPETGTASLAAADDKGVDDLLDDLAELVLKNGGEVVVVPADKMPTDSGAAAVFRF